ncbi:uncharacterized protein METZ01_LOCUS471622, partial [marine metagenome]
TVLPLGGDITKATFTISTWFKKMHYGGWRTLTRGSNRHHHFMGNQNNNDFGVYANNNGNFRNAGFQIPAALSANSWHHFAGVSNATTNQSKLYLDGVYKGTADRATGDNIYAIGNYQGGGQRFAEYLDDFRVYGVALTDNDIAAIAAGDIDNAVPSILHTLSALKGPTGFTATGLPTGLSVNSSGLISGVTTAIGDHNVTITASNLAGTSTPQVLALSIRPNVPVIGDVNSSNVGGTSAGTNFKLI